MELDMKYSLQEVEVEIAEVVLSLQINKPSENWHLDWYSHEYLIATQTFLAKKNGANGELVDEAYAGTEYLLFGEHKEVLQVLLNGESPRSINFTVNKTPPTTLNGKGFLYASPTNTLSVHSGVDRVHSVLGISKETVGFSLVSPPHRGSYKDLVIRGSLQIRFQPQRP